MLSQSIYEFKINIDLNEIDLAPHSPLLSIISIEIDLFYKNFGGINE